LAPSLYNDLASESVPKRDGGMLARARKSGRHVAECLKGSLEAAEYIGEQGICPVCHTNVLEVSGTSKEVICATCGAKGLLREHPSGFALEVTPERRALSHVLLSGKFHHGEDLKNVSLKPDPRMREIPALLEKYRDYLKYSEPEPSAE
jgi:hypothetical protein